jgi:CRP-like cAMP-binding protein
LFGEIHKGGFFGEFTLFDSVERKVTIEAVSITELLKISRNDVIKLFKKNPDLETHLRKVLQKRQNAGVQPIPSTKSNKKEALVSLFDDLDQEIIDKLTEEFE